MTTRRSWIKKMVVATGTAVGAASTVTLVLDDEPQESGAQGPGVTGPAPLELLQPLAVGAAVGHGWTLTEVGEIAYGASTLSLSNEDGRTASVALCRRQEAGGSLASSSLYDLFLLNGSQERQVATEELLGRVVRLLAETVQANETVASVHPGFLTHQDRIRRYGQGLPA